MALSSLLVWTLFNPLLDTATAFPEPVLLQVRMLFLKPGADRAEVASVLRVQQHLIAFEGTAWSSSEEYRIGRDHTLWIAYHYDLGRKTFVLDLAQLRRGRQIVARVPAPGPGEKTVTDETLLKGLPDFSTTLFRAAPYIAAAAMLQAAGKDEATAALLKLAQDHEHDRQVIVLCRMLFVPKAGEEFRRPRLGAAGFLGGTGYANWPREPIELVDGVPFLIIRGYTLRGRAELAKGYLRYCEADCNWNPAPFSPKTESQMRQALDKLLASPKWKGRLDETEKEFLSAQIK